MTDDDDENHGIFVWVMVIGVEVETLTGSDSAYGDHAHAAAENHLDDCVDHPVGLIIALRWRVF